MSDFEDTDLLYRGPGGEQRRLIDQAFNLYVAINIRFKQIAFLACNDGYINLSQFNKLYVLRNQTKKRWERRYSAYYTEPETSP